MNDPHPSTPPDDGQPEPAAQSTPQGRPDEDKTRRTLLLVGGAVGIYMIGRGVYGLLTGEDEQQP